MSSQQQQPSLPFQTVDVEWNTIKGTAVGRLCETSHGNHIVVRADDPARYAVG